MALVWSSSDSIAGAVPRPSDSLRDSLTESFEGTLVSIDGSDLVFEPVSTTGSAAQIALGAPDFAIDLVSPGTEYIVAYTRWMRSPQNPKAKQLIPSGPSVIVNPGLHPAIFLANDDNRDYVNLITTGDRDSANYAERLRVGLDHAEPQIVALCAAEWILDDALRARMPDSVRQRIAEIAADPDHASSLRAFLLASATQLTPELGTQWWQSLATELLQKSSISVAPGFGQDTLIKEAFNAASRFAVPYSTYARWAASNNSGFAETALMAIRRHAPEREEEALEAALGQSLLAQKTRSLLVDHRRRLHLMNASKNTATAQQRGTQ